MNVFNLLSTACYRQYKNITYAISCLHNCCFCALPNKHLCCNYCLNQLLQTSPSLQQTHQKGQQYFNKLYCSFSYTSPLSIMLHRFKYNNQLNYRLALGYLLYQTLTTIPNKQIDLILPVPLHQERQRKRRFNQVELLLDYYRLRDNTIPIASNLAIRIKNTPHQTIIQTQQLRQQNLANAFRVKQNLTGYNILIIDDVITTGATINELAKTCKEFGATDVDVCCLMAAR